MGSTASKPRLHPGLYVRDCGRGQCRPRTGAARTVNRNHRLLVHHSVPFISLCQILSEHLGAAQIDVLHLFSRQLSLGIHHDPNYVLWCAGNGDLGCAEQWHIAKSNIACGSSRKPTD